MNRRTVLKWLSSALAVCSVAVVGIPGVRFLLGTISRRSASGQTADAEPDSGPGIVQRIARLNDLPIGKPVDMPLIGGRRDAWTLNANEVIGRVWLVRRNEEPTADNAVAAFTAVCPHLGCAIQLSPKGDSFVCPCHRAVFGTNGQPVSEQELGQRNHAPRGMDELDCRVVQDADTNEWWVEVNYQKFEPGLTKKVLRA